MSDFNENSFEKAKRNNRIIGILKVIGKSMLGKLKPGAKVAYEVKNEGEVYNVDDIIVFYRDGVKIVHRVEYIFESNGEIFYVTEGVNSETNPYVDSDLVSNDQVIGRVTETEGVFRIHCCLSDVLLLLWASFRDFWEFL